MKIALIGVGSFVFGPSALYDAIVEHNLPDLELALVDRNLAMADLMAGVARRMARDAGRDVRLTTHAEWRDGLPGADFVTCSVAVQLTQRFETDRQIVRRHDPSHIITEFGGIAGISYTLRQIAMITELAADMVRLCPGAWLLNSANPLPRVCEAAELSGVRTVGFCSNSMSGYGTIGRMLGDIREGHPWSQARSRFNAVMAGSNHLTFLVELLDRTTGRDRLPEFITAIRHESRLGPTTKRLLDETGYLTTNGDGHIRDFLAPDEHTRPLDHTSHGDTAERDQRLQMLRGAADGSRPVAPLLEHRAWERPIDFAAAYAGFAPASFHSLNLPNQGQIPNVRRGAFVETPATVGRASIKPDTVHLPPGIAELTDRTVELTQLLVQAALRRDRALLRQAVERDPTVLDPAKGWAAMEECLVAHADLIGTW